MRYVTLEGDMIDDVCERHYSRHRGTMEAVLAANQNLASLPPVLPAGVTIELPEIAAQPDSVIRLYD